MKMLVLGASGGCGRWLVELAQARGHKVTALVRPSTAYEAPPGVEVRRGEILDRETLDEAVTGADVVFSCLGLRRAGKSPWAALLSPPDLMAQVTPALIDSMNRHSVRRIVAISAAGVGDSEAQCTGLVKRMIHAGHVGTAYRDLTVMERLFEESDLDWLMVRPVTLVHGKPTERARPVDRFRLLSTVRRSDVAAWMLAAAENDFPLGRRCVLLGR